MTEERKQWVNQQSLLSVAYGIQKYENMFFPEGWCGLRDDWKGIPKAVPAMGRFFEGTNCRLSPGLVLWCFRYIVAETHVDVSTILTRGIEERNVNRRENQVHIGVQVNAQIDVLGCGVGSSMI